MIGQLQNLLPARLRFVLTPKFLRYLLVGFSTVGVDFVLYWSFINLFGLWYLHAQVIDGIIIFVYNFTGHRLVTFKSTQQKKREQIPRYVVVYAWNYLAGLAILYLQVDVLGLDKFLAKVITIAIIVMWNFHLLKRFVYR